jgi:hypothetical protein
MVSNALKVSQEEVVQALERARKEQGATPEYKKIRKELPKEWPV